ncbi:M48 family metalloprotease [Phytoactinopolyspora mesophila]|uniref:M48 family metalloprotease n=1 Tax=Phytoactinopolyspora mesophila TaxID=2650750 RepID=A0A7K3M1W6_9ACTN|nr:M48 family metalloprotease [Phytoactinopolyspora mesophila]NDL56418.1 M48 family metalloprotease [Phytoactinopolyspora mesophila]
MTHARFRPDRGLVLRVGETWVLLFVITAGYGALIGWALQSLIGLPWWVCLALPVVATVALYSQQDGGVLPRGLRTVDATPQDEPQLYATLERLCALADTPRPKVKIIEVSWVNALAVQLPGRPPTIAVTRGLLDTADPARLEAVLAHELAHVIHRDATVMTFATNASISVLTLPANLVDLIYAADRTLCWFARQCGFSWKPLEHGPGDTQLPARKIASGLRATLGCTVLPLLGILRVLLVMFIFAFGIGVIPAIILLSIPAVVMLTRLSRYREFAADRTAAMLTGQPMELASALTALDERGPTIPEKDLRALKAVSSMAIVPLPMDKNNQKGGKKVHIVERILASHPPVARRVERITDLSRDLTR